MDSTISRNSKRILSKLILAGAYDKNNSYETCRKDFTVENRHVRYYPTTNNWYILKNGLSCEPIGPDMVMKYLYE